ncbi:MAG TPA: SDR family NAD(P)-dependent oxidoreductase [Novosphingobium sp.]|nr:SDR family NAD(P)-dependent oxidoreductase [Novosphingobium sp.]
MGDFDTIRAVVTGGGSGIGAALADALVARGARVASADMSDAAAYRCDVTDRAELDALAAAVERDLGGVDMVFANAGVYVGGSLGDMDPREFDWLFDVNVRGVFNTVQAFLPILLRGATSGRARIVITGSENAVGLPSHVVNTAYTATKHALLAMADGLRRDLEGTGVGVSILCPGAVNTRLWDSRRARQDRFGGSAPVTGEPAAAAEKLIAEVGQDANVTARICLDGVAGDEFLIITDPTVRSFAERRHREVEAALDRIDARLR